MSKTTGLSGYIPHLVLFFNRVFHTCPQTAGKKPALRAHLNHGHPPIVFVQAGEFPHWRGRVSQHAVVVVGADEQSVYVLDPAVGADPIPVPTGDFLLAWSELGYIYAILVRA